MAKRMLIDATHTEETRAVVVSGNRLEEFDFESTTKTQLKGNIYLAKVTRVEPSLQAAFVDYGGNRHGFLAFSEIHPDYYRIPVADREALLAEVSSQDEDIDIEDSGVEEVEDDGMDTTSPHDDDGVVAAEDESAGEGEPADDDDSAEPAAEAAQLDETDGETDDETADADADQPAEAVAQPDEDDRSDPEAPDPQAEDTAATDESDAAVAAEASPEEPGAGAAKDQHPDDAEDKDAEDEKDGTPKPWYARMDQEDIVVRGKKSDEPDAQDAADDDEPKLAQSDGETGDAEEDDDPEAPAAADQTPETEADVTAAAGDATDGDPDTIRPADTDDTPEPNADATSGDHGADDAEAADATAGEAEDADPPADGETARTPSPRRRRGRSRRDRDVESVGGEDGEDFERGKSWHRRYRIQEVISRRQILLVQVAKEERGNKGAALTTYISLAGRYCVLMPNTPRGGGISRKIANPKDRRKLKEIVGGLNIPPGMAVIVRTAGAQRTKAEIRRDYEYLLKLWDEIRERTLQSTAPSLIHEEANLIKRSIRDLYSKDIDEVLVEGDEGYKTAKSFMKLLMPSHAKRVKAYKEEAMPLFHRYQVEQQIDNIYSPTVQLKSGGYIVLNATEALVAIDVNSGRATRERNIEETAYRTNLEAADEIARQLRLRDLAGLIVIDFIDMEEGRNRYNVERRLKEAMKHDRARIQLGRISAFGLLEMSRQRLRPSIAEISAQPCPTCGGSGVVRSIESSALQILRAIEEEGMRQRTKTVTVSLPAEVAFYIMNNKRTALADIEARYELNVFLRGDDKLVPPDHELEISDGDDDDVPARSRKKSDDAEDGERGKKRRRRRRSRADDADDADTAAEDIDADEESDDAEKEGKAGKRGSRRRGRRGGRKRKKADGDAADGADDKEADDGAENAEAASASGSPTVADAAEDEAGDEDEDKPRRRRRRRGTGRGRKADADAGNGNDAEATAESNADDAAKPSQESAPEPVTAEPEAPPASPEPTPEPVAAEGGTARPLDDEPQAGSSGRRRGGWWSLGRNGG